MATLIRNENKIYEIKTDHCLLLRFGRLNSSSDNKTIRPPNALLNKKRLIYIPLLQFVSFALVFFRFIY